MWLLTVSVIILIIVIGFIIYASKPVVSKDTVTDSCPQCPCNRCGNPKPRCRCARRSGGCPFC